MNMRAQLSFCALLFVLVNGLAVTVSCGQTADTSAAAIDAASNPDNSAAAAARNTMVEREKGKGGGNGVELTSAAASASRATTRGDDLQRDETRAQQVARFNRNLFWVAGSILAFFVLCRLWLLWRIAQNRKGIARGGALEK